MPDEENKPNVVGMYEKVQSEREILEDRVDKLADLLVDIRKVLDEEANALTAIGKIHNILENSGINLRYQKVE